MRRPSPELLMLITIERAKRMSAEEKAALGPAAVSVKRPRRPRKRPAAL